MEKVRSGLRHPLPWILVALLVLAAGACAVRLPVWGRCFPNPTPDYNPRAYKQADCLTTNEETTTFDKMMSYYQATLPADASGLRYYSDDAVWNTPPVLYMRFSIPEREVAAFVTGMHAQRTDETASSATESLTVLWQEYGIDWTFAPSVPFEVYRFGTPGGQDVSGMVIVDRRRPTADVYLIDSIGGSG